jgi:hypothetical protein
VTVPVTGIKAVGGGTNFLVMGNVSPTDLVVEYGVFGGNDGGGGQLLFRVNRAGQATQYGHATIDPAAPSNQPTPAPGSINGRALDFTVSADGGKLAFADGNTVTASCGFQRTLVLDTATGDLTAPATPGGSPDAYWVQGMWFDKAGTPFASLVPNLSACATGASAAAPAPWPANAAPIVCKLDGTQWVRTGSGVFRAAYGPGNWLAEQVGVTDALNALAPQPLLISAGAGTVSVTVSDVTAFAWAPA